MQCFVLWHPVLLAVSYSDTADTYIRKPPIRASFSKESRCCKPYAAAVDVSFETTPEWRAYAVILERAP